MLKRRKLALLFLLGVGVPSLALSVLAFRGIQNELALLEQRQLDEYRGLAGVVGDTLVGRIDQLETSVSQITLVQATSEGDLSAEAIRRLDSLRAPHPLLDAVFFLEGDGAIRVISEDLIFKPGGAGEMTQAVSWTDQAGLEMRTGEEVEFQRTDPAAALPHYQAAFASSSDPILKGQALLAVTRVQRKAGQLDAALRSCGNLIREFGGVRTGDGMPLGPIARLERGRMLLATGDSLGAVKSLMDLQTRLLNREWRLARGQYEFFSGQIAGLAGPLTETLKGSEADSLSATFAALQGTEAARRERADRILLFQQTLGGDLLARAGAEAPSPVRGPRRFSLDAGTRTFLVSVLDVPGLDLPASGTGVWGLMLDAAYLKEGVLLPLLRRQVDTASTRWIVRGRDGRPILGEAESTGGSPVLNATIAGGFPPWLIEFYLLPRSPLYTLLGSGQSIYLYMFLAIAIILGFGLVLTIRAVTQELELARLKSDFVSTVSHEFKSPLTSIRQLSEMLQTGRVASDDHRKRYYDVLVEQSTRLSSLVTNVLDLARIEEGRKKFDFRPLELEGLVEEVVEAARRRVGYEGFEVATVYSGTLPPVRGDPEALRQAISNLVNNAIQYSGEARRVTVSTRDEVGRVTVEVADEGIGIPEDEVGKVFDRFYRGRGEVSQAVRGSGLGLTLVKEIVEAHGGTVDITSKVGVGSTFRIHLPPYSEPNHG